MARLPASLRTELLALKHLCYSGLDAQTLRLRVTRRLTRALDLDAFCFPVADPVTALPLDVLHEGRPPEAFEAFVDRVYLRSAVSDIGRCARLPRRVLLVEELLPRAHPERDPYVDVMLRPYGLRHEVHLSLAQRGLAWGHLCLSRKAHAWDGEELALLTHLVPHLRGGLRAARLRAAISADPDGPIGVIVADGGGRIELANRAAERFLAEGSPLRPPALTGLRWVAALLARALADGGDPPTVPFLVLSHGQGGQACRLSAERVAGADGRPRTLILVEPARPGESPRALLALGLTARQAEIACAVVRGATVTEAARRLAISPHTALHHLRQVYDRLGVSSRVGLARRLAGTSGGTGREAAAPRATL